MSEIAPSIDPQTEDPSYIEAMVAKAEGREPNTDSLIAGKYKTEDDLHKGIIELLKRQHNGDVNALAGFYKTLESGLGKQTSPETQTAPGQELNTPDKPADQQTPDTGTNTGTGSKAGAVDGGAIDLNALSAEYSETGQLSEASYKALEAKGFGKEVVDAFIQGQMALRQQTQTELLSSIGGQEGFDRIAEWAKVNMSADAIAAFDRIMDTGDITQAKLALAGLKAQYDAAIGKNPNLFHGSSNGAMSDTYQSWAQVKDDMGNPKYLRDEAFQRMVHDKLGRSKL